MAIDNEKKQCGAISCGGLFYIAWAIAMLTVGLMNMKLDSDDPVEDGTCNIKPVLAPWLVAGGVFKLTCLIFRFVMQRMCRNCGNLQDDKDYCTKFNFVCKFSCMRLFDLLAFIFAIVWLILGTHWVMTVWDDVVYEGEGRSDYCPRGFYLFCFWICILLWVCYAITVAFYCCFVCCTCCAAICGGDERENNPA